MLRPAQIGVFSFFYALGNTPAVNLTQDLPPDHCEAKVLLAGCGDARSVLFTVYNENGDRHLDFTCCDIEPCILSRNILLFSMILDDNISNALWEVYFHFAIKHESLETLEHQAEKLIGYAKSLQSWRDSPYGRVLKFCDQHTLDRVRDVWIKYTTTGISSQDAEARQKELQIAMQRAKESRRIFMGNRSPLNGVRSAVPDGVAAIAKLEAINNKFWSRGTLYEDDNKVWPNPTFLISASNTLTIHYGTNPLLGFHLATASLPLASNSVLKPYHHTIAQHIPANLPPLVSAAQTEFFCWVEKFKQYPKEQLCIRFVNADAISFGHTLQHIQTHPKEVTASLPVDNWSFTKLELDAEEYQDSNDPAPTAFDIIDTSNLVDHLGALNIIVAYAPLLVPLVTSTIYTEILVSNKAGPEERMRRLLCGHFNTMSLLLGLANVESWTDATVISDIDEGAVQTILKELGNNPSSSQLRTRLGWKSLGQLSKTGILLHMDSADLVKIIMNVYNEMFSHESLVRQMENLKKFGVDHVSNPLYNRASFAAFLKHVKATIKTDWAVFTDKMYDAIVSNQDSLIGSNYFQDVFTQLHLQGLYSVDTLVRTPESDSRSNTPSRLVNQKLPSVVCLTVQVPGRFVKYVGNVPTGKLGIPSLCCHIENRAAGFSNIFSDVQAGFGQIQTPAADGKVLCPLMVAESKIDWSGATSLIISAYVPTWCLLQASSGTLIGVGFQPTLYASYAHSGKLGPRLLLYETDFSNVENVFLSEYMPNATSHPTISRVLDGSSYPETLTYPGPHQALTLSNDGSHVDRLTSRFDVTGNMSAALADKSKIVSTSQLSPTIIAVHIGEKRAFEIEFCSPVSSQRSKLRVARKSSYIEIVAPLLSPLDNDFPYSWMFPLSLSASANQASAVYPVSWTAPYLNFDTLPALVLEVPSRLGWVNPHVSHMFSVQERSLREADFGLNLPSASVARPRVDLKDGLLSMFGHITGLSSHRGSKATAFGLHKKNAGGVHVLIFVSKMVLDLANRTIVLDAAVVPLTHKVIADPKVQKVLNAMQGGKLCLINVVAEELKCWKSALPAFAERCRTWKHDNDSCEYLAIGGVPVRGGLEDAASPLCSCGHGHVPKKFMSHLGVPQLDDLLRTYATRVAISPIFAVPHVEPCFVPHKVTTSIAASGSSTLGAELSRNMCASCGSAEATDGEGRKKQLLKCGRCFKVSYCSSECQKKHWRAGHKLTCRKVEKE